MSLFDLTIGIPTGEVDEDFRSHHEASLRRSNRGIRFGRRKRCLHPLACNAFSGPPLHVSLKDDLGCVHVAENVKDAWEGQTLCAHAPNASSPVPPPSSLHPFCITRHSLFDQVALDCFVFQALDLILCLSGGLTAIHPPSSSILPPPSSDASLRSITSCLSSRIAWAFEWL